MTDYINRFLDLLERFVIAAEKRNEISMQSVKANNGRTETNHTVSTEAKPDTASASTGSASGAATERGGRTRTRAAAAGTETADAGAQTTSTATTGRRERTRAGSATTEQQSAGTESTAGATTGRRQRVRAGAADSAQETKPTSPADSDTPEQATLRAELENLCQMAGQVDACNDDVKAFLKDEGWNVASMVPGDDLQFAFDEINTIIDKYFD